MIASVAVGLLPCTKIRGAPSDRQNAILIAMFVIGVLSDRHGRNRSAIALERSLGSEGRLSWG